MNKRQAKKAFKKVYGMSPRQFEKVANDFSKVDWVKVGEVTRDSIENMIEEVKSLSEKIQDYVIRKGGWS